MTGRCPGSHHLPEVCVPGPTAMMMRGICAYCRREYQLIWNGSIRSHNGLPKPRPDGGCSYRCPGPECDFGCYFPALTAMANGSF